jgi:hypothetical protein
MPHPSTHTITAEIGEGLKVDITYSYLPGAPPSDDSGYGPELEVISGTVVGADSALNKMTPAYVRDLAENWLADEGYDMACQQANDERGGDWE